MICSSLLLFIVIIYWISRHFRVMFSRAFVVLLPFRVRSKFVCLLTWHPTISWLSPSHLNRLWVLCTRALGLLIFSELYNPYTLNRAFNVYVRPLIEYCSPVWSLTAVDLINKIESFRGGLQTKSVSNMSYDKRLLKLDNEQLVLCRLRADLLMGNKMLHHFVDIPQDDFFNINNFRITRGNSFKLIVPISRLDARADFFLVRIINVWNHMLSLHFNIFVILCTVIGVNLIVLFVYYFIVLRNLSEASECP